MLEKVREFLFGKTRTEKCPVCGGQMKEEKGLTPYCDINMVCEECGARTDGKTIRTDVPEGEWESET